MPYLESVSGAPATKTKQFGTLMTNFRPSVKKFAPSVTKLQVLPISFAMSVLHRLRRTLEKVTGAI